ncbi:MAG: type II secretion system ATPase GspE [Chlamydiae bacterium]|nr:type II secretion system ATPase GspE [Chlamydiota bacterium]MBI3277171.1 type II secretion system ATPase GspE [Chlamydiota bacterium]
MNEHFHLSYLDRILLEKGLVTQQQLDEAHEEHLRTGKSLGHVLINFGFLSEDEILSALGEQLDMEKVSLREMEIPPEVIKSVNSSTAKLYGIVPLRLKEGLLTIAMADPLNPDVLDDLRFLLGYEIKGAMSNEEDMVYAIDKYYGQADESIESLLGEMQTELSLGEDLSDTETLDVGNLKELAREAPVVKLLNLILIQAIKDRASDIHFEPFETEFKVRYRVDGTLYEMVPPPKRLALALTSRIKVMADMNIAERRLPQDGRIQLNIAGRHIDLRVSTLPTQFGESVVMRVLDKTVVSLELSQLGLAEDHLKIMEEMIEKPNGIIIVTGPTGSGKTTTLYSSLKKINTIDAKIITTEDPIEYEIDGIMQIAIKSEIGLTFARCLRSILRQDPDRIMVGEIRDLETAQIAIQASLTGHLVFTTLHTNDAAGCIARLTDMGAEPFLISSTLIAAVAQRLVRKVCTECKEPVTLSLDLLEQLHLSQKDIEGITFYRGQGCSKCNNTGYKGRSAIFEILRISEPIRELILERAPSSLIKQKARETGMRTLREDALLKLYDGITTFEEIAKET